MNSNDTTTSALTTVLDGWQDGIARHDPVHAASWFTEDALFQGFDPEHAIGRQAVAAYYAKQPVGLTAAYTILEARQLSPDTIVGYQHVVFTRPDLTTIAVHLTAILVLGLDGWKISHYHVSKIDPV